MNSKVKGKEKKNKRRENGKRVRGLKKKKNSSMNNTYLLRSFTRDNSTENGQEINQK